MLSSLPVLVYALLGLSALINVIVPMSGSSTVTPLLALIIDPHQAIGFASAYFVLSSAVRAFFFRKNIQWSEVRTLLLPSIVAAAFGALALVTIPTTWLLTIILGFCIYFLLKKLGVWPRSNDSSLALNRFIGVLSGFLQGTGLAGGDLRSQYLYSHNLNMAEVHGTTAVIGVANFLTATLVRLYTGQLTFLNITPLIYLLPIIIFATWIGKYLLFKIPKKIADWIIIAIMISVVLSLAYKIFS